MTGGKQKPFMLWERSPASRTDRPGGRMRPPLHELLRGRYCPGVVPGLGAHDKLAVAFGFCFDFYLPELTDFLWAGRLITNGVLVADVVGNSPADRIHFVQSLGEKRDPPGMIGDDLQGFPGALGMILIAKQSKGVDRRATFLLQ